MELWTELEKKRKSLQILNLVFYGVATAGVILYLRRPVAGLALTAAAFLGILLVVRPSVKAFKQQVKNRVVEANYGGVITGLAYAPKAGIPLGVIAGSDLLWLKNGGKGYVGREHVTGSYKGRAFQQSDISLLRRQYADEQLEKKNIEYVIGSLVVLDCGRAFATDVEIIHKDMLRPGEAERFFEHKATMAPVEGGDVELSGSYRVYAKDPGAAEELLTPGVTRRIRKIGDISGRPTLVGLVGDKLYVILQGRFVNTDYDVNRPLPQDLLTTRQLPEMAEILALADDLAQR